MLGQVSVYNHDEHTIIEGEISRWLERLVKGDPRREGCLFLVHYNKLDVFCICEWVGGGKDTFVDVLNLGKSLGDFGYRESQELCRRLFEPLSAEVTSKAITSAGSDYHHNLQDEDMEETERRERVAIGE